METSPPLSGPLSGNARATVRRYAKQVADEISRNPLAGIAACFGAGYLAGKLPLFRFATGAVRLALPLAPPLLAVVGATRLWDLLAPPDIPGSTPATEEGEVLDGLLSLTLAARESYVRLAPRFEGEDRRVIEHLRAVHHQAARQLHDASRAAGARPLSTSPPWEGLEDHPTDRDVRLADLPVFTRMLSAEEAQVRAFEAALQEPAVGEENKTMIRRHLLPRAQENVNTLLRCRALAQETSLVSSSIGEA